MKRSAAARTQAFTESVIREMSRVAKTHCAVNLAQGFPDFPANERLKEAAVRAIRKDINQYAVTWGSPRLRQAVAAHQKRFYGLDVDPETQITITCGSTEGMLAALFAVIEPGDEVVVFQPFYENYGPDAILSGAAVRYVTLEAPKQPGSCWGFSRDEVAAAFNAKTKALILNTPHNPTGKVYDEEELSFLADLCRRYDVWVVTDEIYEHLTYTKPHRPMAALPGMAERTITVSGASKTFAVTGWRVGWVISPPFVTEAIRKVHDFLTVGAAAPLQEAVAEALGYDDAFFQDLAPAYAKRKTYLQEGLQALGWNTYAVEGAYYLIAPLPGKLSSCATDMEAALKLAEEAKVAVVPGSAFYRNRPRSGWIRFCFAKKEDTLQEALQRLPRWNAS